MLRVWGVSFSLFDLFWGSGGLALLVQLFLRVPSSMFFYTHIYTRTRTASSRFACADARTGGDILNLEGQPTPPKG